MADRDSNWEVGGDVDPLLPEVGVFPSEGFGEAGVAGGVKVKGFVVGDNEDGECIEEFGEKMNLR